MHTPPVNLEQSRTIHYGAVKLLIDKGKSQARKRILYFMNVFVISGFFSKYKCVL